MTARRCRCNLRMGARGVSAQLWSSPRRGAVRCCLGLALLLAAAAVPAHRGHAVWTDVSWAGEGFEIVHRMHLADAITANRYMGGTFPIEDMRSLALVAIYVEERFLPRDVSDSNPLRTLGAEIEDDFLFVYQEWATPLPAQFPEVDNLMLLDIEPDSQAFIKIAGPGLNEERERR